MERAIIVYISIGNESDYHIENSLNETKELTRTAGAEVVGIMTQKREHYDSKTLLGQGKMHELNYLVNELKADLVVFYQELSPSQYRNVSDFLNIKVIDRIQLILDIFSKRARSDAGKLQVALAQNEYLLPRLQGQGKILSRLGGGIGTRGPGETQLETDRRHLRNEIKKISKRLELIEKHRERTRQNRTESTIFKIGLVGYTNAGKSTLLKQLTDNETYIKDELFATLDPLTRKMEFPNGFEATITDTVGFINDLPPQIINAFHSTLEESLTVDLLLHVIDYANPNYLKQIDVVEKMLSDIGADSIPTIQIFNKSDLVTLNRQKVSENHIIISSKNSEDILRLKNFLLDKIKQLIQPINLYFSPTEAWKIERHKNTTIFDTIEYDIESNQYHIEGYTTDIQQWL